VTFFLNCLIIIVSDLIKPLLPMEQSHKQQDLCAAMSGSMALLNHFNKVLVIGLGQLGLPVAKYIKDIGLVGGGESEEQGRAAAAAAARQPPLSSSSLLFDVYGYDISSKAMERAEKTAGIKKATDFSGFDVYIICVSTHKPEDMFSPQIDGLLSIVQDKISKEAKNGALVSIESTIPKGTSKKVFEMLNHRLHVAHAPHRWYALEEKEHGVNQLRVIGGVCDCCLRVALQFYDGRRRRQEERVGLGVGEESRSSSSSTNNNIDSNSGCSISSITNNNNNSTGIAQEKHEIKTAATTDTAATTTTTTTTTITTRTNSLGIPMHPVPEVEIAELTKIVENAHRYLQIAFAEDLYLYCQANNINFAQLRDSLNTKWNVNILEPREGIGGHCLPKDTTMFLNSSPKSIRSKIIQAAIEVDREYRGYRDTSVGRAPEAVAVRMRDEERRQELLQVAGQFAPMSSSIQQLTSDQLKIDSEINP
jgi:UDP-N-acetyl-D-mannosaminuronic acid dehydrogenase